MQLKKCISKTALIYALTSIIITASQYLLLIPFKAAAMAHRDIANIILSVVPLYFIGLPFMYLCFKRLPDNIKERERSDISPLVLLKYFTIAYALLFTGGLFSSLLEGCLSSYLGRPVTDPASEMIFSSAPGMLLFIFSVIAAPIGEEFIFRYLPFKKLSGFGDMPYILATSICFALFHMNFFQGIYTFFAGLMFGYVYLKTGRLRYNIMLHMMINLIGAVIVPQAAKYGYLNAVTYYIIPAVLVLGFFFLLTGRSEEMKFKASSPSLKLKELMSPGFIFYIIVFIFHSVLSLY